MTTKPSQNLSIFELVTLYEEAAKVYGEALEHGKSRIANKQHTVIGALRKEFKRRGEEGRIAVVRMMSHEAKWVRLLAAGFVLRFDSQKAVPILQELALLSGNCGFTAEMILELWREGRLPPEE